MKHDPDPDAVIKAKHLNVRKACRNCGRGKCICYDWGFLVNIDGHEERFSPANNIRSSLPDVKIHEAPVHAGEDRHYDNEQYIREGQDAVPEGQAGMIVTEHQLPDVLVPTITIPEGMTVNTSVCQQVTREVQGGRVRTLQYEDCDNVYLEQMAREVRNITCQHWGVAQQICQ
jgi:hypothetical protein